MTIDEALNVKGPTKPHYRIVQVTVGSPSIERAGWLPNSDYAKWFAAVEHSDGQYGGGIYKALGETMELAIDAAVEKFRAAM